MKIVISINQGLSIERHPIAIIEAQMGMSRVSKARWRKYQIADNLGENSTINLRMISAATANEWELRVHRGAFHAIRNVVSLLRRCKVEIYIYIYIPIFPKVFFDRIVEEMNVPISNMSLMIT